MNAQFILPSFCEGQPIYSRFFSLSTEYPEILYPNTEIYTIFGIFPGCIWCGGRGTFGGQATRWQMEDMINYYNEELEIPLTFTFTNPLLEEKHYYDTYGNIIAELGNNNKNKILVSDLEFEHYLRTNYPNYKYCRSIIASEEKPYALSSPYGEYEISVLKRRKNNDWNYLDTIPQEDRASIEFLCNDPCPDNCPRIYTHYLDLAKGQLMLTNQVDGWNCTMGQVQGIFRHHYSTTQLKTYITREAIDKLYLPRGFCKFKCAGRSSPTLIMFNLAEYLVKEEYRQDVLGLLLASIGVN